MATAQCLQCPQWGLTSLEEDCVCCVLLHEVLLMKLSGCVAPGESHPLLGVLRVAVRNVTDGQMNET